MSSNDLELKVILGYDKRGSIFCADSLCKKYARMTSPEQGRAAVLF